MATYQAITTGQTDAESYIDTVLAGQWTNNVLAIFEGDPSAASVRLAGDLAMTAVASGPNYRYAQVQKEYSLGVGAYTRIDELVIVVPRTGVYQLSFDMRIVAGTGYARIYRNAATAYSGDVAFGAQQTVTASSATKTESSLALNAGDVLSIYVYNPTANVVFVNNFILASNTKLMG